MTGALIRIALRYGIGALAGWGVGEQLAADPDVQVVVTAGFSIGCGIVVEGWYWAAKKFGWAT